MGVFPQTVALKYAAVGLMGWYNRPHCKNYWNMPDCPERIYTEIRG